MKGMFFSLVNKIEDWEGLERNEIFLEDARRNVRGVGRNEEIGNELG